MDKLRTYWKELSRHLMEVWIEVRPEKGRVAWPTFENIKLSTKVVIISSIGLGLFIGLLDVVLGEVLKVIVGGGKVGL